MKKVIALAAALVISSLAMADSVTLESGRVRVTNGADQQQVKVQVKHDFDKNLAGDVSFTQTQTDVTNALSNRIEFGLIPTVGLGPVTGYTRVALGQKTSNTQAFGYYSIEPGVSAPVGPVVVKAGIRWRSATDSVVNGDQTHTKRIGVSYALTKTDAIGLQHDRMRGDNTQNITAVNYTHSF